MIKIKPKTKKKARIGRPPKPRGYSLMVRKGELPETRKYLRLYLTEVREGLIEDLGPTEEDLTSAQKVMIDRVINKLAILRCIEEQVLEDGVFLGSRLCHVLGESYLAYSNSIRLDLQALGINKKQAGKVLDLGRYLAEKSRTKARKARPEARRGQAEAEEPSGDDMAGLKIVDPGAPEGDASGQTGSHSEKAAGCGGVQAPGQAEIVQPGGSQSEGGGAGGDK